MSDVWEMLYNNLELFPGDDPSLAPGSDRDGDGVINIKECLAGTDPFSGLPPRGLFQLQIAPAPWPPNTFRLTVPLSAPGKSYTFSTSPDLSADSWTPADPMEGNGQNLMIEVQPVDELTNELSERAFFRASVKDQPNPGGPFSPWELAVLAARPDIAAALEPLISPPGGGSPGGPGDPPPPLPNSDNSGPPDPYDAAPFDNQVDWKRTPEAKLLHISVDGVPSGFKAVDVSDSGKILFTRTTAVTDYAVDPVGLVWDPAEESPQQFQPVMFTPGEFELNILKTTWAIPPGGAHEVGTTTIASSPMPMPEPPDSNASPDTTVSLGIQMKAIAADGSLLADVDYSMREHGGHPEKELRSGNAKLVFVWVGSAYNSCRMLGSDRGYSGTQEDLRRSEDHSVGFFHNTNLSPASDEAIITHTTIRLNDPSAPTRLAVHDHSLRNPPIMLPWLGYNDHIPHLPVDLQMTRSGKVLVRNRVNASEINYIVCGRGVAPAFTLASSPNVTISDLPDGTDGWGIGQAGGVGFRVRKEDKFESVASLAGVLAFDRQGNGIGDGQQGRHIWRNAQWHTLEQLTGIPSLTLTGMRPKKITASGLVWISDPAGTSNSLLIPVEIVAPALGHHDEETEYDIMGADELKVAKMEHSLNAAGVLDPDLDPHRFYVRIPSRLGGVQVVAKLGTVDNPESAYDDPATEIPLTADPEKQESESQLLVSDEVDDLHGENDEEEGDRTHRVMLGGNVEISSVKIGSNTYPLSMKVPVKVKKKIEGKIVLVGSANTYGVAVENIFRKTARERFAQLGIECNTLTITTMDVPDGLNEFNVLYDGMGGFSEGGKTGFYVHNDVKKLVDKAIAENKRGPVTVFIVRNIGDDDPRGFAITERRTHSTEIQYANVAVISLEETLDLNSHPFTFAHEVGHVITNHGHYGIHGDNESPTNYYGADPKAHKIEYNLMRGGTSPENVLKSSKRLYIEQFKMLQNELLVDP